MSKTTQNQMNFTPQSQSNAGNAGGTIYYINLGGLKIAWGTTAQVSGTGTMTITLPSSFFTAVQAGTITADAPYVNTNVMTADWASDIVGATTSVTFTPLVIAGASPNNKYCWILFGT